MKKTILMIIFAFLFCISLPSGLTAQETESQVIKGQVSEIAEDGSYIIVDGTKIITDSGFIKDYMMESGDKVEITATQEENGLVASECSYIIEEEAEEEETADLSLED